MIGNTLSHIAPPRRDPTFGSQAALELEEPRQLSGATAMLVVGASQLIEEGRVEEANSMLAHARAVLDQEIDLLQKTIQDIDEDQRRTSRKRVIFVRATLVAAALLAAATALQAWSLVTALL